MEAEDEIFDDGILKDLSVEDMDQLRNEINTLDRQVRAELESRERNCPTAGSGQVLRFMFKILLRLAQVPGRTPRFRLADEGRVRAQTRLCRRSGPCVKLRRQTTPDTPGSNPGGTASQQVSLRNMKIRRVLDEYRIITGES